MRFNDAVFGTLLILFAIVEIAYTTTFPSLFGQKYGPNLFPIIIGGGLALCGVLLVIRGVADRATVPLVQMGEWASDRGTVVNVALLIGAMVFYILFSDWLGFVITSILILLILLVRLGSSLLTSIVIAVVATLLIQTVFGDVLLVPLPWGILQPYAW